MIEMATQKRLYQFLRNVCEFSFLSAIFILPFSKAGLEILLVVAFISWFLSKLLSGEPLCENQLLFLIAGLFIISSSVSAFYSGYPLISARGIIKLVRNVLVMLLAFDLFRDPNRIKRLCVVTFFGLFFVIVDSLAQQISGKDLIVGNPTQSTDVLVRLSGPFTSYGLLAAFLIAVIPVAITYLLPTIRKFRPRYLFLALLIVIAFYLLYKTYSRGAWLAAFGSWIIFSLMMHKIARFMLLFALTAILILAPLVLPRSAIIHLDINRKEQSLVERFHLWVRALQIIEARPWFGCGINTFSRNYAKFDQVKNQRVMGYPAHNGYLQLAAETGLVSLAIFFFLVGAGIRSGLIGLKRAPPEKRLFIAGLLTGFTALLFQAMVDTTFHSIQSAVLIWLFFGLLLAACNLEDKQHEL